MLCRTGIRVLQEKQNSKQHNGFQVGILFNGLISIGLVILGKWVFLHWTRGEVEWHPFFFYMMVGITVLSSLYYISVAVPVAVNLHMRLSVYFLGSGVLAVMVAALLARDFDLVGIASALLLNNMLNLVITYREALPILQQRPLLFLRSVLQPPNFKAYRTDSIMAEQIDKAVVEQESRH